jgi:hypothetical protein
MHLATNVMIKYSEKLKAYEKNVMPDQIRHPVTSMDFPKHSNAKAWIPRSSRGMTNIDNR